MTVRKQKAMKKLHLLLGAIASFILVIGISSKALVQPPLPTLPPVPQLSALPSQQPSQKPSLPSETIALPDPNALLDIVSNFVIQKFQSTSCQDLAKMKPQSSKSSTAGTPEANLQAKAVEMLRQNPEMRKKFINRVAGPIANRMFECKIIP